jgi:hypothetical protein
LDWDGNAWFAGDVYVGSTSGTNKDSGSKKLATETYVDNKVANLVNSAPDKLNTLDELAAALGDDENFANTVTTSLSNKLEKSELNTAINIALEEAKESGEFDGAPGVSGVYVGAGKMPDDCNVQIDPEGEVFTMDDFVAEILAALPVWEGGNY